MAVSALLLTLATAASIPSAVLLRRLRIRRRKSLAEIATRFRGGFGRYGVTMAGLHSIRTSHQADFNCQPRSYEDESAHCLLYLPKRTFAVHQPMSALGQKRTSLTYSITSSARARTA